MEEGGSKELDNTFGVAHNHSEPALGSTPPRRQIQPRQAELHRSEHSGEQKTGSGSGSEPDASVLTKGEMQFKEDKPKLLEADLEMGSEIREPQVVTLDKNVDTQTSPAQLKLPELKQRIPGVKRKKLI